MRNIPSPLISVSLTHANPCGMIAAGHITGVSNCWISSSVQLLANDPLVSMFVDYVCGRDGMKFPESSYPTVNYDSRTFRLTTQDSLRLFDLARRLLRDNKLIQYKGVLKPGFVRALIRLSWLARKRVRSGVHKLKPLLVRSLIYNLWLINHGDYTKDGILIRKQESQSLFKLTAAIASDIPNDGFASFTDAYYLFKRIIISAMSIWWNASSASLYINYGVSMRAKTIYFDMRSDTAYTRDTSAAIENSVELDTHKRTGYIHLNNELTRRYFNRAIYNTIKFDSILQLNPTATMTSRMLFIDTLPLRFTINIQRVILNEETKQPSGRFNEIALMYNPRSFILGPTLTGNLYARYRLVGRIIHSGNEGSPHYTANILHPKRRNEPYNTDTRNSKPDDMLMYNWDVKSNENFTTQLEIESKGRSPTYVDVSDHDPSTGLFSDTHGVLLEFEKYIG